MPELLEFAMAHETTDLALVTTAETLVLTSEEIFLPAPVARAFVQAWAVMTTGAGTTAVTPRVRRGNAVTGTIIDDAVAKTLGAAAGSNEDFEVWARDENLQQDSVQYSLTLQQAGATGNGTFLQGGMVVLITT